VQILQEVNTTGSEEGVRKGRKHAEETYDCVPERGRFVVVAHVQLQLQTALAVYCRSRHVEAYISGDGVEVCRLVETCDTVGDSCGAGDVPERESNGARAASQRGSSAGIGRHRAGVYRRSVAFEVGRQAGCVGKESDGVSERNAGYCRGFHADRNVAVVRKVRSCKEEKKKVVMRY
jgi:hypothetical protein